MHSTIRFAFWLGFFLLHSCLVSLVSHIVKSGVDGAHFVYFINNLLTAQIVLHSTADTCINTHFKWFSTENFLKKEEWMVAKFQQLMNLCYLNYKTFNSGFNSHNRNSLSWMWNGKNNRMITTEDRRVSRGRTVPMAITEKFVSDCLWTFICFLDLFSLKLLSEVPANTDSKQLSHKSHLLKSC